MQNDKIDELTLKEHKMFFPKDSWKFREDKEHFIMEMIDEKKFHVSSSKLSEWKYVDDNERSADDVYRCEPIWLVDPRYLPRW